jgi:membrane protein YdbS with pleckstrin-like domain
LLRMGKPRSKLASILARSIFLILAYLSAIGFLFLALVPLLFFGGSPPWWEPVMVACWIVAFVVWKAACRAVFRPR